MSGESAIRRLDADTARDALVRAGFQSFPRIWVTSGCVFTYDSQLMVCGVVPDSIIGTTDLYVAVAPNSIFEDPSAATLLAARLSQRFPHTDRTLLRCPGSSLLRGSRWRPYIQYFAKTALVHRDRHSSIELASSPEDFAFVHACLSTALEAGYQPYRYDASAIAHYVTENFSPRDSALRAAILRLGGRPLGHITWKQDQADEVSAECFDEIIDVFAIPEFAGQGVSASLLEWVESMAAQRRMPLLGNVIRGSTRSGEVIDHLTASGWRPHHEVLIDG